MPPPDPRPPHADPLYRDVGLSLSEELPVLGIPVVFETDDDRVLDVVRDAFGIWHSLADRPELVASERLRVRIVVHEGDEGAASSAPPVSYRMPDAERLFIHTPGSMAVADSRRRESVAYVTPELVEDAGRFRHDVLQTLVLFLAMFLDRSPVHAAGVVRRGTALLLAGETGVGKSTLAWACARSGDRILSDDVVFVQTEPALRLWGVPGSVRLDARARTRLSELEDVPSRVEPDGREKIAVDVQAEDLALVPPVAEAAALCVLERGGGPPRLTRMEPGEVVAALAARQEREPGFDLFAGRMDDVLARLARAGGWHLRLGPHPEEALSCVNQIFESLHAGGSGTGEEP